MYTRRQAVWTVTIGTLACSKDLCEVPAVLDDGPFPYPAACPITPAEIEGPYYRPGAPERTTLDLYGDDGAALVLNGQVFLEHCDAPLAGAVVEVWHADPDGVYDNTTDEMRYRARITTDGEGKFSVRTLLPGRYLDGEQFRPRHVHVKVFDPDGYERLTTQVYFEGDPYIPCDPYAHTSLVLPFTGTEDTTMTVDGVWFVITAG